MEGGSRLKQTSMDADRAFESHRGSDRRRRYVIQARDSPNVPAFCVHGISKGHRRYSRVSYHGCAKPNLRVHNDNLALCHGEPAKRPALTIIEFDSRVERWRDDFRKDVLARDKIDERLDACVFDYRRKDPPSVSLKATTGERVRRLKEVPRCLCGASDRLQRDVVRSKRANKPQLQQISEADRVHPCRAQLAVNHGRLPAHVARLVLVLIAAHPASQLTSRRLNETRCVGV